MYFGTYRLQKTWLDKCVKGLVSEERSINHMINGLKHSLKLNFYHNYHNYL